MNIIFNKVEGSQTERPLEVDTISSKKVVYIRKNIERISRTDEQTGETVELWQYDEAILSQLEYATYSGETANAKAEYVAMMTDVDLMEV